MFHMVFCRSERVPDGQDLANWIMDIAAFDEIPRFEPPFEQLAGDFTVLEVYYDEQKRPVQFERYMGEECAECVEGAVEVLRDRGYYREKSELVARLRESKQAFAIEFDELLADEGVWELLDVIEARLARELDGVIDAEDEGFFDGEDQPLVKFS
jgi:hypothetical protein